MNIQPVGLQGLNSRAIQYAETELNAANYSHTERNTLLQYWSNQGIPIYMGLIKTLHDINVNPVPIIAETELENNFVEINDIGQEITYSREFRTVGPRFVEDVNDATISKLGYQGEPFFICLDRDDYVAFDILTYDRYNGKDVYVLPEPIRNHNGNFVYTVRLVNLEDPNAFFPREGLVKFQTWYKIGTVRSEFSSHSSRITNSEMRKLGHFVHYTSSHLQSVKHEVTGHACISSFSVPTLGQNDYNDLQPFLDPNSSLAVTNYWMMEAARQEKDPNGHLQNVMPKVVNGSLMWIPTILLNITR